MRTSRIVGAIGILLLASGSQRAEACVYVYTDINVDMAASELDAWVWVGDAFSFPPCYYDAYNQWGYWEHTYHATVSIESPTLNTASDVDALANIPYGGESAEAFAYISTVNDAGDYEINFILWLWCTIGGYLLNVTAPEVVSVCSIGSTDAAAIAARSYWPQEEPWERGVLMFCGGDDSVTFDHFGDSFGTFYEGAGYTNDPCKVSFPSVVPGVKGITHSHPWFDSLTEYRQGVNCHEDDESYTSTELYQYNTLQNIEFSEDDKALSTFWSVPTYLRTPDGDKVRRYWPPGGTPHTQTIHP